MVRAHGRQFLPITGANRTGHYMNNRKVPEEGPDSPSPGIKLDNLEDAAPPFQTHRRGEPNGIAIVPALPTVCITGDPVAGRGQLLSKMSARPSMAVTPFGRTRLGPTGREIPA